MGGPVAERAELTDKNPPRLERYDRWGHDISEVVMPPSFLDVPARHHGQQLQLAGDPRGGAPAAASGSDARRGAAATCSTRPRSA